MPATQRARDRGARRPSRRAARGGRSATRWPATSSATNLKSSARVAVEDDARRCRSCARVPSARGRRSTLMPRAEVRQVDGRSWRRRGGASSRQRPPATVQRAGRAGPVKRSATPSSKVSVSSSVICRRQDLDRDVVERAARAVGADADRPLLSADRLRRRRSRGGEDVGERSCCRRPTTRDGGAVDRDEHVVVGVRLDLDVGLRATTCQPRRVAVAHLELVGRDVDAGELEVGRREVVEDHVGVGLPAAGRLRRPDLRPRSRSRSAGRSSW